MPCCLSYSSWNSRSPLCLRSVLCVVSYFLSSRARSQRAEWAITETHAACVLLSAPLSVWVVSPSILYWRKLHISQIGFQRKLATCQLGSLLRSLQSTLLFWILLPGSWDWCIKPLSYSLKLPKGFEPFVTCGPVPGFKWKPKTSSRFTIFSSFSSGSPPES